MPSILIECLNEEELGHIYIVMRDAYQAMRKDPHRDLDVMVKHRDIMKKIIKQVEGLSVARASLKS